MISMRKQTSSIKAIKFIILVVFALIMLFPLAIMVSTSLKGENEIYMQEKFTFIPEAWRFANFIDTLKVASWGRYFFNSFFVTSITVVGSLFFNSLAGYSFAVLHFRFRNFLFIFLLIGIMIPYQSIIIPQYLIMKSIPFFGGNSFLGKGGTGWLDTYWALIIPQLSGSIGIFLCRQYYLNVPYDLHEAAKIDGCNPFQTFIRIYIPLSKPIYASLGILKTVAVWNDFFYPLIMTTSDSMRTVQLGLQSYQNYALFRWDLLMAANILVCLPLVIAFLMLQRLFIQTAVSSGLKA